jgi:YVTN family beta-propeller protein
MLVPSRGPLCLKAGPMPRFATDFQNSNRTMLVQRRLPSRWIKDRAAQLLLALFAVFSGWLSASAQSPTPGCLPYSTDYPCIYVADFGLNEVGSDSTVTVINATTNSVVGPVSVAKPNGSGALGVAVAPNNAVAYIALQFAGAVAVIDTATNTVIKSIQLQKGSEPSQIAISPDGAFVWVAEPICQGCKPSVEVISTDTYQVKTLAANLYPTAVTISSDGSTAYVADSCQNGNQNYACIDIFNTSTYELKQIPLPNTVPPEGATSFDNASIAITPDGSLVCVSVQIAPSSSIGTYGVAFMRTSDQSVLPNATFSQSPASQYGLGITSDGTLYLATSEGIVLVNTSNQTYAGMLQFGTGPTGVAVGPDGVTVYVTNSGVASGAPSVPPTVSVIKGGLLITTINKVGNSPQGVAVMPSLPPTIVTQPSSQTIGSAQSATLSVVATGTPPLTYQWYQGQSGDTSSPIQGATGSSYTTPASLPGTTSYWVAVSNLVTSALGKTPLVTGAPSTTATIMPTLHAPTCALSLQGTSSLLTVMATAICTDGQQQTQPLLTTLFWGDLSSTAANGGTLVANKTYSPVQTVTPYIVTVTSTDTAQLSGTTQVDLLLSPATSVFAGQAVNVGIQVSGQISNDPVKVSFECATVIDSNGHVSSPSDLNISCTSSPSVVTLDKSQSVAITVQTTGGATSLARGSREATWFYAFLLPIPGFLFLGMRFRIAPARRIGIHTYLAMVAVAAMLPFTISCGGGFTPPKITQISTPAGSYQITVVDMVVGCQTQPCPNTSGFVQTTLIVPLVVSPTQ